MYNPGELTKRDKADKDYDAVLSVVPDGCRTCPRAIRRVVELSNAVSGGDMPHEQAWADAVVNIGGHCLSGLAVGEDGKAVCSNSHLASPISPNEQ